MPEPPKVWERWTFKRNRGTGRFTVVAVADNRVTLRDRTTSREKTISLRTLRSDYEPDA